MSAESLPDTLLDRPDRRAVLMGRGDKFTREIGDVILDLTGTKKPNVLVLTTPASTPAKHNEYVDNYRAVFGRRARVDVMHRFIQNAAEAPGEEEVTNRFGDADAVLISGGNTTKAREIFVNTSIGQAVLNFNGVTAGGSTGAILQTTEALSWYTPDPNHQELNDWIPIQGLTDKVGKGIVRVIFSPHLDYIEDYPGEDEYKGVKITEPRSHYFGPFLQSRWGLSDPRIPRLGLGVDDGSAIAFLGESFRVFNQGDTPSEKGITTYVQHASGLIETRLTPSNTPEFVPTSSLQPVP